jgi:hypothetical protein
VAGSTCHAFFRGRPGASPMAHAMGEGLKCVSTPGGATESAVLGLVLGKRTTVGAWPSILIAPLRLRVSLEPCPGWGFGRFMESSLFKNDLLTDHEPWHEEWSGRPSSRPSPGGRRRIGTAGFGGLSHALAGTSRDGSHGWGSGMSLRGRSDSLSLRERVGVREPVSTLAMACIRRFMESANE